LFNLNADKCWLAAVNEERIKEGDPPVSELFFEFVIDRIEKEWFELVSDTLNIGFIVLYSIIVLLSL